MSILACSAPDCEQPTFVKKRQLCRSHYNRFMSYGDLTLDPVTASCLGCGEEILRAKEAFGPSPKYCTVKCRADVNANRYTSSARYEDKLAASREANAAKPKFQHECIRCSVAFESRHKVSRFCSQNCGNKWRDEHNEARCSADGCDRGVQAKGICSMHYKRALRSVGKLPNEPWDERRKANSQKRRAQKLNLPAETIRPHDVYERDEWTCGLCRLPADRTLVYPDPSSASLDHILPLSKGGHHVLENVQLGHLSCNVRKGARVEADAMSA